MHVHAISIRQTNQVLDVFPGLILILVRRDTDHLFVPITYVSEELGAFRFPFCLRDVDMPIGKFLGSRQRFRDSYFGMLRHCGGVADLTTLAVVE